MQGLVVSHRDAADLNSQPLREGGWTEKSKIRTMTGVNLPVGDPGRGDCKGNNGWFTGNCMAA